MPALCPATEGCQAWKRSRKPVAGYCLSKLNKKCYMSGIHAETAILSAVQAKTAAHADDLGRRELSGLRKP